MEDGLLAAYARLARLVYFVLAFVAVLEGYFAKHQFVIHIYPLFQAKGKGAIRAIRKHGTSARFTFERFVIGEGVELVGVAHFLPPFLKVLYVPKTCFETPVMKFFADLKQTLISSFCRHQIPC
ncbi:MAG: hypothetical protein RR323_04770 [Raoultibacter sp.]